MSKDGKIETTTNEDGSTNIKLTITAPTTVPCTWCGAPTTFTGTKHCDPCHELDKRISDNPELAARMVGYFGHQQNIKPTKLHDDVLVGIHRSMSEKAKGK